jgi:hypothetical protein
MVLHPETLEIHLNLLVENAVQQLGLKLTIPQLHQNLSRLHRRRRIQVISENLLTRELKRKGDILKLGLYLQLQKENQAKNLILVRLS